MQITCRSKDVIKSGGEWISSVELEKLAVGCPSVINPASFDNSSLKTELVKKTCQVLSENSS